MLVDPVVPARLPATTTIMSPEHPRLNRTEGAAALDFHAASHLLAQLPRGQVTRRFGPQVVERLDQALGAAEEALSFRRPPTPWFARLAFADEKLDEVSESGPKTLVGCDLSCLMHLEGRARRRRIDIEVKHVAEVLAGDDRD